METLKTTTFLVIRHGETVSNTTGRFQGQGDSPLTNKGRQQAMALGKRLAQVPFDELYSSDLGRAVETANAIAHFTGHKRHSDIRLRERDYGVVEGLSFADVQARYPDVFDALQLNDPDYLISQGESLRQHYRRNIGFMEERINIHPGLTTALVVHGGVLDSLFRFVTSLPLQKPRCFMAPNASLGIIVHGLFFGSPRWVIRTWGDISHLDGNLLPPGL